MFPVGFWDSPLWKEAARAGLRQISKLVSEGNISGASRLATTPGVLKPSAAGSQIKHLGQGAEGLATMVAHPEHGVAVRKLYDPRGISSQEMIARKEEAGRALGNNPHFAKFLGSAQTPQGGQMHFNEFVQSGQAPTGQVGAQSIKHTQVQAQKALHDVGFAGGKDIRGANMLYDQNTGTHKVVDYVPARQGEFMRQPKSRDNVLSPTQQGANLFNLDNDGTNSTAPGMLNRLLGKGGTPGGVRSSTGSTSLGGPSTAVQRPTQSSEQATGFARPRPQPQAQLSDPTHPPSVTPPIKPVQPPATAVQRPPKPAAPSTAVQRPKPVNSLSSFQQ